MELNVYLIGALVSEDKLNKDFSHLSPVKLNHQINQVQFFLEIINDDDIPAERQNFFRNKFVAGYENNIKNNEWESLCETRHYFRDDLFKEFAKNKLFIFKPYLEEDRYGRTNIKISNKSSVKVIERPKGISDNAIGSLVTIPIFNDYNQYTFEKRLLESKSIGNNDFFEKITTSCLVSGDYLYGEFKDFEKLNDGWHVKQENTIKKIPIDFDKYNDFSIIEPHAIYMDFDLFNEVILENGLSQLGQPVSLEREVKLKKNIVDSIDEFEEDIYSENDFLENLFTYLKSKNLILEEKQIVNFHTALKTRRLVILSGPSGTGKSQLVFNYAHSLGLMKKVNKDTHQFKMIPVKPNWRDDTDLIGFLDTINNIYRPSESGLIDTLIEAKDNRDKIYLICFDEMNLAKVEYYFSQFLSVLELEGTERKISLYSKNLVGRVINGEQYPHEIPIHSNVLFVGTINIDETTQTLSDKVLDRSNYIELNIPENHINNWVTNSIATTQLSSKEQNSDDKVENIVDLYHFDNWSNPTKEIKLLKEEIQILNKINQILINNDSSKGIGFRVLDHINSYMLNLPPNQLLERKDAFDLQISQKIIPKLRGTIDELDEVIKNPEDGLLRIFEEKSLIISSRAIIRKLRELDTYGYTY
ncbi:McrB family protein [Sporosarcina obsidiansis]|uniref:McrB family protein n=1 Tax=Sporosarcina obsidiansis TaxID=2660748 RepID=UPI00129BE946|nr:hypothetical protein [Sporosarcina obsidiansis]